MGCSHKPLPPGAGIPANLHSGRTFIGVAFAGLMLMQTCTGMELVKIIRGDIAPKSIGNSGTGLFFAQNMMYRHSITVYDRTFRLVKTIPDMVNLAGFGYVQYSGLYSGAPVEVSFSDSGRSAWVSNYLMTGTGFSRPGCDTCPGPLGYDASFVYRIDTRTLEITGAVRVGSVPKFLAATPDGRLVLVSNWSSGDISVIDAVRNDEVRRIRVGRYPRGIVVDPASRRAYIAVMGSYDVAVLDLGDFSLSWLTGVGRSPRHVLLDPHGRYLYATLNGEGRVAKVDLTAGSVVRRAETGDAPRSMAISDDGEFLYVTNYKSDTVSKVRTHDMAVIETVPTDEEPIGITYDPVERRVWVACYTGSIMVFQD